MHQDLSTHPSGSNMSRSGVVDEKKKPHLNLDNIGHILNLGSGWSRCSHAVEKCVMNVTTTLHIKQYERLTISQDHLWRSSINGERHGWQQSVTQEISEKNNWGKSQISLTVAKTAATLLPITSIVGLRGNNAMTAEGMLTKTLLSAIV